MTRHPSPPTGSSPAAEIPLSAAGAGVSEIRRLRFLVYGVVLVSSLLQTAIAPLLPSYAHRFQLSGFQTAVLLASTGVAALLVSVPAGTLADRFGARGLTLWAGWLMALATAGQAVAPSYPTLVAARLVFGLGYGMVWTAALAWLANVSARRVGACRDRDGLRSREHRRAGVRRVHRRVPRSGGAVHRRRLFSWPS